MSDLPTGWADEPIDALGEIVGGGTPSRAATSFWGGSIPWVTPTDITALTSKYVWDTPEKITDDGLVGSAARLLPRGAIVVTTRATLGEAAIAAVPLTTNQGFKNIIPNETTDEVFTYYLLKTLRPAMLRLASGTTFPEISKKDFSKIRIQRPIRTEQERIGALLDTADEAIAKTEAVIAKLRQVRTGLIHDLLTCGLDENGHIRDPITHPEQFQNSPLGSIPCDWEVLQLRDTIERVYDYRGRTPLKIGMAWGGGDIPALSANNVEMGQINFSKESHQGSSDLYERWMTQGDTEEGDVLMTMEAPLGNIAQVPDNRRYILSQRVILLRPKTQRFTKDYLALQMAGPRFQKELIRQSSGSTAVGIQRAKLELMHIAVPRRREEQDCAAQIVRLHDKQIRQHEAELIKLQSIKTGLMDDLLTGRVRVPETT